MSLKNPLGYEYYSDEKLLGRVTYLAGTENSKQDLANKIIELIRTVESNAYEAGKLEIQFKIKSALDIG